MLRPLLRPTVGVTGCAMRSWLSSAATSVSPDKVIVTAALNGVLTDPAKFSIPVTPAEMALAAKQVLRGVACARVSVASYPCTWLLCSVWPAHEYQWLHTLAHGCCARCGLRTSISGFIPLHMVAVP
jgi:hypothetical protein